MPDIVQASCPHCQKLLRIPAEWIGRPMVCKHCRQGLQTRLKTSPAQPETANLASSLANPEGSSPSETASDKSPDDADIPFQDQPAKAETIPASPSPTPADNGEPATSPEDAPPEAMMDPFSDAQLPSSPPIRRPVSKAKKPGKSRKKILILTSSFLLVVGGLVGIGVAFGPNLSDFLGGKSSAKGGNRPGDADANEDDAALAKKKSSVPAGELFPRRALLININNYQFANPLHYGSPRDNKYPGSSTNALRDQLQRPPMNIPPSQIFELSDGSKTPHPPVKSVIETTFVDFLDSSRRQDRILVLFAGHAVVKENAVYLVPIEGILSETQTLIPLLWIYKKLDKCQARQKVLILDVCRFAPARGFELPAGGGAEGKMTEEMDVRLERPPAGVQVWAACVREQQSIELDKGSVFLQALCNGLQERLPGISDQNDPFPLDALAPKVNQRIKDILEPQNLVQTPRLIGKELPRGAKYDPKEPLAQAVVIQPPAPPKVGKVLSPALTRALVEEFNLFPPARISQAALQSGASVQVDFRYLPPFALQDLEGMDADGYSSLKELQKMVQDDPEKYAVRKAVLEAGKAILDSARLKVRDDVTNPGDMFSDPEKDAVLEEQKDLDKILMDLEEKLENLKGISKESLEKETSKRWRAHYYLALARLQGRLLYLSDYFSLMTALRADSMPPLQPFHTGWRLASRPEPITEEEKNLQWAKEIGEHWKKILEDFPRTPWAALAQRENLYALGLEWKPKSD